MTFESFYNVKDRTDKSMIEALERQLRDIENNTSEVVSATEEHLLKVNVHNDGTLWISEIDDLSIKYINVLKSRHSFIKNVIEKLQSKIDS